jgi:hypothetical protein
MSEAIVKRVDQVFPALLETNVGATCFRFIQICKATLEAAGHKVRYVVKTNRDGGQYTPPGFGQRQIKGTDNHLYTMTGVSHDVLYIDDVQRDLIISGNYYDEQIFDAGKQVRARPKWGEVIPPHEYRAWNPPLPVELESLFAPANPVAMPIEPPPAPRELEVPGYDKIGDDAFFVEKVGAFVAEEMGLPQCRDCGSHNIANGMNKGSASWIARTVHSMLRSFIKHRDTREADAIALKHRNEMRAVLNRPPL